MLSYSQSTTLEATEKPQKITQREAIPSDFEYGSVMVIPFKPKMYRSDIDKQINEKTGWNFEQIRQGFRKSLNNLAFIEVKQAYDRHYGVMTLLGEDPEMMRDLAYIYKSIGYQYKEVPQDDIETPESTGVMKAVDKVKAVFEPATNKEEAGTTVKDGQLYSVANSKKRYMSATVINPNVFTYLSNKYQVDLFLFVNELDLMAMPGTDYRDFAAENYRRMAKIHYTVFDKHGKEISGGAAKALFPSNTNHPDRVVKGHLAPAIRQIAQKLPAPKIETASNQSATVPASSINPSAKSSEKTTIFRGKNGVKKEAKKGGEHEDVFDDY